MTAAIQNFSIGAGNAALITVTVDTTVSGDTLADATIEWQMFAQSTGVVAADALPLIVKTNDSGGGDIVVLGSPPMTFTIQLVGLDTASLIPGNYYHEAVVIDGIGGRVTILNGIVTVSQSIISA